MKKKILALMLASTMVVAATACGNTAPAESEAPSSSAAEATVESSEEAPSEETPAYAALELEGLDYDAASAVVYDAALGEFYEYYMDAKEATNVSEKYAKMAIAEAKLMESAIMLPLYSAGGNYAIGRTAPYTVPNALWGNDSDKFAQLLVTTEPIKTEDRSAMKAKWAELKGTGTYMEWAKEFLTSAGYTIKDTYAETNSSDPETWDVLATSKAADSEKIVQTYDGLYEYDVEGTQSPALALTHTVSDDGLVYTFKLREGAIWVDSQGRKVDDVTADDFVAGMQHMMDAMGGLEYLIENIIVNASAYIYGEISDFSQVGVKAIDDYTLEYTLNEPCSYFLTMLSYSIFAPMSRDYYESQGGKFGAEYDSSAASYTYGSSPDNIAYCGPFLITNATEKNSIVFKHNESYYNPEKCNIKTFSMLWNDGSEATKAYNDMKAGVIDASGLNSSALELAKGDGWFDQYQYVTSNNATSYMGFYNLYRSAFANVNDPNTVVSAQDEATAARTQDAMQNVHFRRAISMAADRGAYNAMSVGEELKLASIRNCYTPGNFVSLEEEVTVDINGEAKTYPAGTWYGQIMQDQIDADGVTITVWDPAAEDGIGSSDTYDGWYNPANAQAELAIAIEELASIGVEVSAENPIYFDVPYNSTSESRTNMINAYKQSIEAALEGKVIVNLVACASVKEWYYSGYYTSYGYEANYDMYDLSGWGPDYGDPSTYLDTMLPEYAGYMVKCLGIY